MGPIPYSFFNICNFLLLQLFTSTLIYSYSCSKYANLAYTIFNKLFFCFEIWSKQTYLKGNRLAHSPLLCLKLVVTPLPYVMIGYIIQQALRTTFSSMSHKFLIVPDSELYLYFLLFYSAIYLHINFNKFILL